MTTLRSDLPTVQSFSAGEIDYDLLPQRLRPLNLSQASNPLWRNLATVWLRAQELQLNGMGGDFQADTAPLPIPSCDLCKGVRSLRAGYSGRVAHYIPCPSCVEAEATHATLEMRQTINQKWRMFIPSLKPFVNRPNAPMAMVARAAQQELISRMPEGISLLLIGDPGTGKTRLMSEIAYLARERGLGTIFKTLEFLRGTLQNFGGDGEERARNKTRRDTAWQHLLRADVLVIDEIDHAQGPAIHETLLEILNHRYDHNLTTVLGGNSDSDLIPPVLSRLYAATNLHVDMTGDSDARELFGMDGKAVAVGGD